MSDCELQCLLEELQQFRTPGQVLPLSSWRRSTANVGTKFKLDFFPLVFPTLPVDFFMDICHLLSPLVTRVTGVSWSLSQSLSEGRAAPLSSDQLMAGPDGNSQPLTRSFTPTDNCDSLIDPTCMFLGCGRNPENPERTQQRSENMQTLHRKVKDPEPKRPSCCCESSGFVKGEFCEQQVIVVSTWYLLTLFSQEKLWFDIWSWYEEDWWLLRQFSNLEQKQNFWMTHLEHICVGCSWSAPDIETNSSISCKTNVPIVGSGVQEVLPIRQTVRIDKTIWFLQSVEKGVFRWLNKTFSPDVK